MRLCLLDSPCLARPAGLLSLPASAPGLLLAWLGLRPGWHVREALAAIFLPDASTLDAQRRLRVTLHRARQWLAHPDVGAPALQAERNQLRWQIDCDVAHFDIALRDRDFGRALALHRAPLMHGRSAAAFPELDRLFSAERERLLAGWRMAALREAERLEAAGDLASAFALLQSQLEHDVLAEDVVQALLRVAGPSAQRTSALVLFERFRQRLHDELAAAPAAATGALAAALRADTPAAATRERPRAGVPWGANPFVRPEAAWQALTAPRHALTLVIGPAGSGKSRLLSEAWPGAVRWTCRETTQSVPLLPVARMLQTRDEASLRRDVPEPGLRRELARLLPALADGQTLPPPDATQPRLLTALVQVLPRWIDRLVVDDLQWVDAATLHVLHGLLTQGDVTMAAGLRIDGESAPLAAWLAELQAMGRVQRVELAPLSQEMAVTWLQGVTGRHAPGLAGWLREATGGNPFLMRQLLAALHEEGPLAGDAGAWPVDLDAALPACRAWPLPQRVLTGLHARLERLAADERRVLQAVAVSGRADDAQALAGCVGLSAWAVAGHLAHAEASGWIAEGRLAHDLLREALLRSTPAAALRLLQAAVARTDTRQPPHQRAALWQAAGDEAAAVEAALQAARQDSDLGLTHQALQALAQLEPQLAAPVLRSRLAAFQGWVTLQAGDSERAWRHLERARAAEVPPAEAADLHALEGFLHLAQGDVDAAARCLQHLRTLVADHPELLTLAGHVAMAQGDHARMQAHIDELAQAALRWPDGPQRAQVMISQSAVASTLGHHDAAVDHARRALAMARRARAPHIEVEAARNLVIALSNLGRDEEAVAVGEAALTLGDFQGSPVLKNNLALAHKRQQCWDRALALYHAQTADPDANLRCVAWANLIDIHARRGAPDAAALAIEAALAALARSGHPQGRQLVLTAVLMHGNREAVARASALAEQAQLTGALHDVLDAAQARLGQRPATPQLRVSTPAG